MSAERYPLSQGERSLWFVQQRDPSSTAYNLAIVLRIHSELDVSALRRGWEDLWVRYPSLRSVYVADERGEPWRQVLEDRPLAWVTIDASDWSEEELQAELVATNGTPIDLACGPLMRVALFMRKDAPVLLISFHHIGLDLVSGVVLIEELGLLYAAHRQGNAASLPPATHGMEYVAKATDDLLRSPRGHQLEGYWKTQLEGIRPTSSLPRPSVRAASGASHPPSQQAAMSFMAKVPPALAEGIRTRASALGVSSFVFLLAAFQVLLHRHTREDDIVAVSPISGRQKAEFERIFGYLINTIALRGNLGGDPSFADFVSSLRGTVKSALVHGEYPFSQLMGALALERDPGRTAPFPVCFAFRSQKITRHAGELFVPFQTGVRIDVGGLILSAVGMPQQEGQFDLQLEMIEAAGTLVSIFRCSRALFDEASIARLNAHFETLLEAIVDNPERPVGSLPLLPPGELDELLVVRNDTARDFDEMPVHRQFERHAACAPERVAAIFAHQKLTYGELNGRANALARRLVELGVGREHEVGLCVERSLDWVVAVLGIMKSGAAFVPLDPTYPAHRLSFMLSDSRARVLVTQPHLRDLLATDARILELSHEDGGSEAANLDIAIEPHQLAYAVYTSGSTGTPKGVLMPHRALANLAAWHAEGAGKTTLQFAPTSFDVSIQELFCTLAHGGCLVVASDDQRRDPRALLDLIETHAVARLFLPVVALHQLAETAESLGTAPPCIEQVLTAGEQLRITPAIERFFRALPRAALVNQYGPTETHLATEFTVPRVSVERAPTPPIGRPIQNARIYVLDAHLRPAPIGAPGELYIGGAQVARGYSGRPELTAERFVPDPFTALAGARMYKTGDLARHTPDGEIEFLGRVDRQIKVRGYRVEPSEVETVIANHEDVRDCAVDLRDGHSQQTARLIAYIVGDVGAAELRDHLRGSLPDYMIPSAFVKLDAMPLSPSGKVDRARLPEPEEGDLVVDYVAPRTPEEQELASIWAEVLGRERVGVRDNFFELGGHSLLLVQILTRVRERMGIELPLRAIFEAPTIAESAETARSLRDAMGGELAAQPHQI